MWNERDPYISADGQKLFFCSDRPGGSGSMDVWMATWNGSNWNSPVNCGPNVNSDLIEWSPSVSPDGTRLYFLAFGRPGGYGGWDVWYSDWDEGLQQWGPAQNMGPVINTPATEWSPEISRDGQTLYYASDGLGHPGGQALAFSRWNGSSWGIPQFFPLHINFTGTEERPSLTSDENTMYFVRWVNGPRTFVTEKDETGSWSQPLLLDSIINHSSSAAVDPNVTSDGKKLFYSSARSGGFGSGDIWEAERIIAPNIPTLDKYLLLALVSVLTLAGLYWAKKRVDKPA
jgi:Tol biopolymer transport system component